MNLPQYHPIPENDAWWGKGFTEWTNVTKARPAFPGHHQPHLPADLGYYDLRLPEARLAQAQLASEAGIGGFCYYHYWFHGHRLLERPVDDVLNSGEPDFPFCLCWANEGWSRAWDGKDRDVLIAQTYSDADDDAHIELLCRFFADPRYIRLGGKPLFIVYRSTQLPNPRRTFERWRERARQLGIGEICLAQFEAGGKGSVPPPADLGLDLTIEFAPDWRSLGKEQSLSRWGRLGVKLGIVPKGYGLHRIFDYRTMVERTMAKEVPAHPFVRCVSPGFDNSPRRERHALILKNNHPEIYEQWLSSALQWTRQHDATGHEVVFINAWNEWAEGNHLEPDTRHGRAFLDATRRAIEKRLSAEN